MRFDSVAVLSPLWVFLMLVGSVAADTKATKERLTHSTTTLFKPLVNAGGFFIAHT